MPRTHSAWEIDALLRSVAARQFGLVTAAQAIEVGVDRHALFRRRATGALVPMHSGVMRLSSFPTSLMQRILAASLAAPGAIVVGPSAAAIAKLPLPHRLLSSSTDVVLAVKRSEVIRRNGIRTIRTDSTVPSVPWMGTRVSTVSATIPIMSPFVDPPTLERCLDHCLAHRLVSVESVRQAVKVLPARIVGSKSPLHEFLRDRSDGQIGHRSNLESQVGRWLTEAGLGGWRRNHQVPVGEGEPVEVDFGWPNVRVALEVSPFFTHGARLTQARDAERRRLLTLAHWRVVEALDDDLVDQRAFTGTTATLRALMPEIP